MAMRSDLQLIRLLEESERAGEGIGGSTRRLDVAGVPVFAKCIPVTDLELSPDHRGSTANLFDVPTMCHYGVGSSGASAWRELAAHIITTNWVLTDQLVSFTLLYHWRVLPIRTTVVADEGHEDLDTLVAYWEGSPAVRGRLEALAAAASSVVLFLEHVPWNLSAWLTRQFQSGEAESACLFVEEQLLRAVPAMNQKGLVHFDTHARNILTDGEQLYLSDFGLAASTQFDLTKAELAFLEANRSHDACHAVTVLVNMIVSEMLAPRDAAQRNEFIRRLATGDLVPDLPAKLAALIERHAPVAAEINDFYWKLFGESRATPYPAAAIQELLEAHAPDVSPSAAGSPSARAHDNRPDKSATRG
jgi:serine/threonine protein kinase